MNNKALVASSAAQRGETTRFERLEAPRPGTYWRLLEDITGEEDGKQISSNPLTAGTVLLLEDVESADGEAHVYTFAAHPGVPEREAFPSRFHADCFFRYWAYCPDGEQVRERELLALTREMERTQGLMLQPPPAAKPVASLDHKPAAPAFSEGQALATTESVRDMAAYAERLRENAEATTAWITQHSQTLQMHGAAMARFHMERAKVGLSAAKSQLDAVKGILRTVENLQLYTGNGVVVTALCDGEPAAPDAPLTIYQELLALDEELLLHLEDGGLDHTHLDSIAAVLADDALLRRLIPAERGIVLCKFRGSYKEFVKPKDDNDLGASIANEQLNSINQLHMLLVRDGAQVYLVDGPDFLQGIRQLMPNAAEQRGHYTDRWGEEIRREHLAYARAQREQLGALNAYAKVLIMLWGLRDRGVLFGSWNVPAFASWLDWGFQARYLRLVDQSTMLVHERPSYDAYRAEQNRYLGIGACVAVRVSELFQHKFIPGAFARQMTRQHRDRWDYSQLYTPKSAGILITRVRSDKHGVYAEVPLEYAGYARDKPRRDIVGRLYLTSKAMHEVLVLDRVHAADLRYYLSSRSERRNYKDYVQLFQAARAWVAKRDAEEAPMREQLRQAVSEARLRHEPEALEAAITAALAVARTTRRDKRTPSTGSAGYAAYRKGALDTLHALLTNQAERIAHVEVWAQAHGRRPLRLVSTGKGEFKLYLEPAGDEHDPRLGEARHATSAAIAFDARGGVTLGERQRELLRPAAGEHVIHDWQYLSEVPGDPQAPRSEDRKPRTVDTGAVKWLAHQSLLGTLRYEQAASLLELPARQSARFQQGYDLNQLRKMAVGSKNGYVVRRALRFAVGVAHARGRPCLLVAEHDTLAYCYNAGDAATKQACIDLIRSRYANPEAAVAKLAGGELSWELTYAPLSNVWPYRDEQHCAELEGFRYLNENNVVDVQASAKANEGREVRCVGLTAAGAQFFPWLATRTINAM